MIMRFKHVMYDLTSLPSPGSIGTLTEGAFPVGWDMQRKRVLYCGGMSVDILDFRISLVFFRLLMIRGVWRMGGSSGTRLVRRSYECGT